MIGSEFVPILSINPATGEHLAQFLPDAPSVVEGKLQHATRAFDTWRNTSSSERSRLLRVAASLLRRDADQHAKLMTAEMGKPIGEARAEVEKCAWVLEYYAQEAAGLLTPREVATDGSRSFIRFDPLGPILAVMPWNFPFWQVFRFAAPNLAAGNVGLLKHASNVTGCAMAIERVFREAGFPKGVFQTLVLPASRVAMLIDDVRVKGVSLTGSEAAGQAVGARAGAAIKPSVLELGGSDPLVVLSDGDPRAAARVALKARMLNAGQSCIAAKRFIVVAEHETVFVDELRALMAELVVGDPICEGTHIGPLARPDFVSEIHLQVMRSIDAGARCLFGGTLLPGPGAFYPPTLLVDVTPDMSVFQEETFGPVAVVTRAKDDQDAIRLANQTPFGLGASLWTTPERGAQLAGDLEAGHVAINGMVKSDPRLPFGGVKASGYGRELGAFGILPFLNLKTVWVA